MNLKPIIALLATATLTACGSNQKADQNAGLEMNAGVSMNATTTASTDSFAGAEQTMMQAMMSAVGTDVGDNWARKMIAHHQGAIDMSQIVLQENPTPDVAEMARMGIQKQQMDINSIKKLLKDGPPDQKSADLYKPAMMEMQQNMQSATGANVSETFMRKMLAHHEGAVAMSDVALKNGVTGALRAQVQKTRSENQKDAEMVQAMLDGKPMQHAMKDSGASTPAQMAAEPKRAEQSNKTSGKKSSSGDMSSMSNMSNMEMNHM